MLEPELMTSFWILESSVDPMLSEKGLDEEPLSRSPLRSWNGSDESSLKSTLAPPYPDSNSEMAASSLLVGSERNMSCADGPNWSSWSW